MILTLAYGSEYLCGPGTRSGFDNSFIFGGYDAVDSLGYKLSRNGHLEASGLPVDYSNIHIDCVWVVDHK